MSPEEIQIGKAQIVAKYGDWTAHNIHLGHGIYTRGQDRPYNKLLRILQTAEDICEQSLTQMRVLDLACLEGGFAIEFARHGAEVLGIEGREANLAKARFAKNVLELDRLTLELGDVRDLSRSRHGEFDIVICAGILYHLDAPAVFEFVERIAEVCTRVAIIDTSFALHPRTRFAFNSRVYWGNTFPEHDESAAEADLDANLWGSLDNMRSAWLTKSSLLNLLRDVGFTTVMETLNPCLEGQFSDRIVLAAIKGQRAFVHATPSTNTTPFADWEERPRAKYDPMQRSTYRLEKRLTHLIPIRLRQMAKSVLRRNSNRAPWEWPKPWVKSGRDE